MKKNKEFRNLNVPKKEVVETTPALANALKTKEYSESKKCSLVDSDDLFAYSGHRDYSSVMR
jgi:hypothetical protein